MIDCHTHVFPPRIAPKLAAAIGQEFHHAPAGDGSVSNLLTHLDQAGLSRAICSTAALRPDQMIPANSWMLRLLREEPRLIPLGTVHPLHPHWAEELDKLEHNGVKGLKIHPDLSGIPLDSPIWKPIWLHAQNRFLILLHMGPSQPAGPSVSQPKDLAAILDTYPDLRVVAAHLGGLDQWEDTIQSLAGRELYFDTSCCSNVVPISSFAKLIEKHGTQRLLFGSDYPLFAPAQELSNLNLLLQRCGVSLDTILDNGVRLAEELSPAGTSPGAYRPAIDFS